MTNTSVVGCGNMGGALVRGLARSGDHTVTACDVDADVLDALSAFCSKTTTDLSEAAEADVVFVAVKPGLVGEVVEGLDLSADQTLVTIAAGVSTEFVAARTDARVVRVMPNLAAETGDMAAAVTPPGVGEDVKSLLSELGTFVEVEEAQMDIATAVNGSGPAFVFYLIDAMKRAGVEGGLTDDDAQALAAQTFKGAAETVLRSGRDVEELIDAVCSPKGTTIEGMGVLWDSDVEDVIVEAVLAAERRSKELARGIGDE